MEAIKSTCDSIKSTCDSLCMKYTHQFPLIIPIAKTQIFLNLEVEGETPCTKCQLHSQNESCYCENVTPNRQTNTYKQVEHT